MRKIICKQKQGKQLQRLLIFIYLIVLSLVVSSCDDPPSTGPDDTITKDIWSFPEDSKYAVSLYTDELTISVGDSFDVKVVFYNMSYVFGAALEIYYDADIIQIDEIVPGPFLSPESDVINVIQLEPDSNRVSYGATFISGSGHVANGSGVVAKLKCFAQNPGNASFLINEETLEIKRPNGSMIFDFEELEIENLSVTIE